MDIASVARIATELDGVTERAKDGIRSWRYRGRLVARELDPEHVVIRTDFDARDVLVRTFPDTFSIPPRYAKHMMVVADLRSGSAGAIEEAILAAWRLQSGHPDDTGS